MSESSQDRTTAALSRVPVIESLLGAFVRMDGAWAIVNQGDTAVRARAAGAAQPVPGDAVRLERRGGDLIMLGPAVPRPTVGKILVVATPRSTVEVPPGSGETALAIVNSAYSPTVNDIVQVSWDTGAPTVLCKLPSDPTAIAPTENAPVGGGEQHPPPFTANDSGSVRVTTGAWWTTSVRAGDPTTGSWFYGPKIRDTIPDTAIIRSARIYLPPPTTDEGYATFLGLHSAATKPTSGLLPISGSYQLPAHSGWVPIPTAYVDFLKANDGGLGLVPGLGFTTWPGRDVDGMSGALDIVYA